jgi:hypothetical protein
MAFFSQMGMGMPGMGGSPSAFTSPGMDPMTLALLLRMQNAGTPSAPPPQIPAPPSGLGGAVTPGMVPPVAGPQGGTNLMQLLSQLSSFNPQNFQRMLGMFGMGGGGAVGAPTNLLPSVGSGLIGPGTGGNY